MILSANPASQYRPRRGSRGRGLMRKKTILVVDDEPDQREIYHAVLRHAGYAVLEAADAVSGIRIATESVPDLILLDIALPVMDGWEAVRLLKDEVTTAGIPVCAISARVLAGDEIGRVERAGFACYLLKPIEPRQVLKEVADRIGPPVEPNLHLAG